VGVPKKRKRIQGQAAESAERDPHKDEKRHTKETTPRLSEYNQKTKRDIPRGSWDRMPQETLEKKPRKET